MLPRSLPWLMAAAFLLLACDTPGIAFVDPDVTANGAAGLEVHVVLEDPVVAEALGWEEGVPNAAVMLQPIDGTARAETLRTSAAGVARKKPFLPGYYRLAAYRRVAGEETAATGGVVRAFGGGLRVRLGISDKRVLTLQADQRGSLVFSELYPVSPFNADIDYDFAQYYELYNNADTSVYLDGLLWGTAWRISRETTAFPCEETAPFRTDSLGIWARFWHSFPGAGRDHPVAAGATVLIAMDAVDHSAVDPRFPDLTRADFELIGSPDVDNPNVPNMPEAGLAPWLLGHGLRAFPGHVFFIALPVSAGEMVRMRYGDGTEWARVPAERVLDVVLPWSDDLAGEVTGPPCLLTVHARFDRLEGGFHETGEDLTLSFQRRILQEDSKFVLQDVNTSFTDLVIQRLSPGTVGN